MNKVMVSRLHGIDVECEIQNNPETDTYIHCYGLADDDQFIAKYNNGHLQEVSTTFIAFKLNYDELMSS